MAAIPPGRVSGGRARECETLDRLLDGVRAHRSQVLVLCGEAGTGKTTLLDYVEAHASGCHTARATGIESEMELSFAGLHQFCAPVLDRLDHLPGPQHEALGIAFGVNSGNAPDRFRASVASSQPALLFVVLISAIPPDLVKNGLPIEEFDGFLTSLLKDRGEFYRQFGVLFYGLDRPNANVSQSVLDQFWLKSPTDPPLRTRQRYS